MSKQILLTMYQRVLFRWTIVRIGFQVWLLLGKGFKGLYLNGFLKIHAFLNIRCPFLVSYLKKKTIWSNMVYIVFIQSYSCSIAVNQLKRKFVMSVITQPFSFWRMFKKAGIFKKPFKYRPLNPLPTNNQTQNPIRTIIHNTRYCLVKIVRNCDFLTVCLSILTTQFMNGP